MGVWLVIMEVSFILVGIERNGVQNIGSSNVYK